jgi:hypothetical protein
MTSWLEPPSDEEERRAWRLDPQHGGFTFWEALCLAVGAIQTEERIGGDCGPLADYLAFGPRLTLEQQRMLADLIREIPAKLPHGARGKNKQIASSRSQAEYQVARRVIERQRTWCEQHPTEAGRPARKVPDTVTASLIQEEISAATSPLREAWQTADAVGGIDMVEQIKRLLKNRARVLNMTSR